MDGVERDGTDTDDDADTDPDTGPILMMTMKRCTHYDYKYQGIWV